MIAPDQLESDPVAKKLSDIGHLGSAVGHHVINAFTAIVSNVEMLRLRGLPPSPDDLTQLIDDIVQVSVEASGVARRLIDYTRPVTSPKFEPVQLNELITEFIETRQSQIPDCVELRTQLEEALVPIQAQASLLVVMLDYLLANAIDSKPGGPLTITFRTLTDERGWVVLELYDNGPGMSDAALKHAVEPFFTTRPGHVGVGLSIANGIWRRHRGTMSIQKRPEGGTTVRLCIEATKLPRAL